MAKKFNIEARNEQARNQLAIVENELHYAELRCKALLASYAIARTRGDASADRIYLDLKMETSEAKNLETEKHELEIMAADKKYANQYFYSDIKPWEVIEEKSPVRIVVRRMNCTMKPDARKAVQDSFVPGGFLGHVDNDKQEWDIVPDENGLVVELRKHKDGNWYEIGDKHTPFVLAKEPVKIYDFNF